MNSFFPSTVALNSIIHPYKKTVRSHLTANGFCMNDIKLKQTDKSAVQFRTDGFFDDGFEFRFQFVRGEVFAESAEPRGDVA